MTVTQLNPPLPLETPRGPGLAHFMIDYGPESHLMWTVFIDATGECWTFQNPEIRAARNTTLGRTMTTPIRGAAKTGTRPEPSTDRAGDAVSADQGENNGAAGIAERSAVSGSITLHRSNGTAQTRR